MAQKPELHHHDQERTESSSPRPLPLRILAIFCLVFPLALYLISFSLTLKTIYSPNYALSRLYNSTGDPTNITYFASPFYTCNQITGTVDATTIDGLLSSFNPNCTRTPFLHGNGMAKCIAYFKPGFDDVQGCQAIVSSASLYVAAAVLIGIALLLAGAYLALSFSGAIAAVTAVEYVTTPTSADDSNDRHAVSQFQAPVMTNSDIVAKLVGACATLLALLAAGCLILAQILGVQGLVNEQHPTAGESQTYPNVQGRWYMGPPALVFTSVAWLSASIGAFTASTGCGVKGR